MELLKDLMTLGNRLSLDAEAELRFPYEEDDTPEDRVILDGFREDFIQRYDKRNHRQFAMTKTYCIPEYKQRVLRVRPRDG
tara:strand:+ start:139 stop:381 length:243 start_codon:yes stop_codon:yes gene_type:complete